MKFVDYIAHIFCTKYMIKMLITVGIKPIMHAVFDFNMMTRKMLAIDSTVTAINPGSTLVLV